MIIFANWTEITKWQLKNYYIFQIFWFLFLLERHHPSHCNRPKAFFKIRNWHRIYYKIEKNRKMHFLHFTLISVVLLSMFSFLGEVLATESPLWPPQLKALRFQFVEDTEDVLGGTVGRELLRQEMYKR